MYFNIKNFIKKIEMAGLTPTDVARQLELAPSTVLNWTKGKQPRATQYPAICRILHCTLDELRADSDVSGAAEGTPYRPPVAVADTPIEVKFIGEQWENMTVDERHTLTTIAIAARDRAALEKSEKDAADAAKRDVRTWCWLVLLLPLFTCGVTYAGTAYAGTADVKLAGDLHAAAAFMLTLATATFALSGWLWRRWKKVSKCEGVQSGRMKE